MNKNEEKLVKLYTGLTGVSESCARSVFMLVCSENKKSAETIAQLEGQYTRNGEVHVEGAD